MSTIINSQSSELQKLRAVDSKHYPVTEQVFTPLTNSGLYDSVHTFTPDPTDVCPYLEIELQGPSLWTWGGAGEQDGYRKKQLQHYVKNPFAQPWLRALRVEQGGMELFEYSQEISSKEGGSSGLALLIELMNETVRQGQNSAPPLFKVPLPEPQELNNFDSLRQLMATSSTNGGGYVRFVLRIPLIRNVRGQAVTVRMQVDGKEIVNVARALRFSFLPEDEEMDSAVTSPYQQHMQENSVAGWPDAQQIPVILDHSTVREILPSDFVLSSTLFINRPALRSSSVLEPDLCGCDPALLGTTDACSIPSGAMPSYTRVSMLGQAEATPESGTGKYGITPVHLRSKFDQALQNLYVAGVQKGNLGYGRGVTPTLGGLPPPSWNTGFDLIRVRKDRGLQTYHCFDQFYPERISVAAPNEAAAQETAKGVMEVGDLYGGYHTPVVALRWMTQGGTGVSRGEKGTLPFYVNPDTQIVQLATPCDVRLASSATLGVESADYATFEKFPFMFVNTEDELPVYRYSLVEGHTNNARLVPHSGNIFYWVACTSSLFGN
jgi:hypothetical protein